MLISIIILYNSHNFIAYTRIIYITLCKSIHKLSIIHKIIRVQKRSKCLYYAK